MNKDILVLGKSGQLGQAFKQVLGGCAHMAGRDDIDLASPNLTNMIDSFTKGHSYRAVINAAAYTKVDKVEGEGREPAQSINADGAGVLAKWCVANKLPLIHYSTDYVYSGEGNAPLSEEEPVAPLNTYGKGKLDGERLIVAAGGDYLIFRTSWVYDAYGKNFFNTMLRLFSEKNELSVVSDQIGAPTYAVHLAEASISALDKAFVQNEFPSGVYNLAGGGETSWHGFAQAIFRLATSEYSGQNSSIKCKIVHPIASANYPTPAKRPLNSRLDCSKAKKVLEVALPSWEAGLEECFKEKYENTERSDSWPQNNRA